MRILIVFPNNNALSPLIGATTRSWNLIKWLLENNYEVFLIHSINAKGFEDPDIVKKIHIFYHKNLNFFALKERFLFDLNPFYFFQLRKIIKRYKIDVVQIEFSFGFFLAKILSKNRYKIIYESHSIEREFIKVSYFENRFPKILYNPIRIFTSYYEKFTCKIADAIICISKDDKEYYIKEYKIKENKCYVIPTPSSLRIKHMDTFDIDLKINARNKLNLPLEKIIIVFHGSIPHPPNEEAFHLIEKYISPKIEDSNILFVIAGNNLKKYRSKNIISLGFVEDLSDLLFATDFAIVPIVSGEGIRTKIADYISAGVPFISTKKGMQGMNFLEDKLDFILCDSVDIHFINAIKRLANNFEYRESIRRNLLKKTGFLDYENIGKKYFELYKDVLKNK